MDERSSDAKATVIAFANQKGGTGKSTCCGAFADILSNRGMKVLIVDLDPQPGNLSYTLAADRDEIMGTYELLCEDAPAEDCIQRIQFCDLIAADTARLDRGAVRLASEPDGVCRLADALASVMGSYDYIMIDTPPTTGVLTVNALVAADEVIIPTDCDVASAYGMAESGLMATIAKVRRRLNPDLAVRGVVISSYDCRSRFAHDFRDLIHEVAVKQGVKVLQPPVRASVRVREAREAGMGLVEYVGGRVEGVLVDYECVVDNYLKGEKEAING